MKRFTDLLDRPFVGLIIAVALAGLWSSALWWFRPATLFNDDFVNYEQGHNLYLVDQLLAGKRLYRDVFSQYGPLPAYAQAVWATCLGNTARTYLGLTQLLTLVNVGLLYQLLRRSVPVPLALGWLVAAVFPYLLLPGSFVAGGVGALYPGFERMFLLLIALAWVDPRARSGPQAYLLGILLGGMQWVKFGGAFMAGAALLATDLLILGRSLANRETWRSRLGMMRCILAGFLGMEFLRAATAFLTLPTSIAADVLWPAYMLKNYASYAARAPRYVSWHTWRFFAETQLPVAMAALLNAGLVWRVAARRSDGGSTAGPDLSRREGPLLFFACYFPLAVAFYLPHMWVAVASAWIFLAAGIYVFNELRWPARGLVLLALFPCFYVSVRFVLPFKGDAAAAENVAMPNGEHLWLKPAWKDCFARTRDVVEQLAARTPPAGASPEPSLLIFTIGSGWYHYFPARHFTRHTYMMAGFVRPNEERALVDSLPRTTAVVVFSKDGAGHSIRANPGEWKVGLNPFFGADTDAAFARQLGEPINVDDYCTIFPIKH